jgi:hypothetical protein
MRHSHFWSYYLRPSADAVLSDRIHPIEISAQMHRRSARVAGRAGRLSTSGPPTNRSRPRKAPSRRGAARRTIRSVGGTALRKGYRGRFGMYVPPLLEALGKAELTHEPRNNRVRAAPERSQIARSKLPSVGRPRCIRGLLRRNAAPTHKPGHIPGLVRRNARVFSEIHAVNPRIWRLCPNVLRLPNANAYGWGQPVALPC